jgi:Protocatechuate 3,4-dioxygenase beta subunit
MNSDKSLAIKRRDFFKKSILLSAGGAGLILPLLAQSGRTETISQVCQQAQVTIPLGQGPLYPIKNQEDKDNDLTLVKGHTQRAKGEVIYLYGRITDRQCQPIQNAMVEIWQVDANGRYDHIEDHTPGTLDPNFQHWGLCQTDEQGGYEFITIMPISYPGWGDWVRPPHVHFRVSHSRFYHIETQMFFPGDPLNVQDKILQQLPPTRQSEALATLENYPPNLKSSLVNKNKNILAGAKQWKYDIVLRHSPK